MLKTTWILVGWPKQRSLCRCEFQVGGPIVGKVPPNFLGRCILIWRFWLSWNSSPAHVGQVSWVLIENAVLGQTIIFNFNPKRMDPVQVNNKAHGNVLGQVHNHASPYVGKFSCCEYAPCHYILMCQDARFDRMLSFDTVSDTVSDTFHPVSFCCHGPVPSQSFYRQSTSILCASTLRIVFRYMYDLFRLSPSFYS